MHVARIHPFLDVEAAPGVVDGVDGADSGLVGGFDLVALARVELQTVWAYSGCQWQNSLAS